MAPYAKMVDLGDIGAALRNLPSPQKPEEELGDEPDPMWVMTLGHSGSIKSVLEDWTRYGSKSPRASFFRWAARDHISSPVQGVFVAPERSMHLRHENRLAKFMQDSLWCAGPGGRAIAIVTAARDLRAGECLSRDVDACADSLLLDWGLASTRRRDDVSIHVGIKKGVAQSWQATMVAGWLRQRSSSLRKALDPKLWVAARILGCSSKAEALGADWDVRSREEMLRAGLDGVSAAHRRRALWVLKQAVQSALDYFETTAPDDEEVIRLTEDERQRVAAAYRLGKKQILSDVLALLEKADAKIARRRALLEKETSLPAVVTGKRKSTKGKGTKRASMSGASRAEQSKTLRRFAAMVLFVLSDPRLPFGQLRMRSAFDSTNPWLRSAYAALGPGNRVTCLYIGAGSSMRSQALLAAEEEALPTVLCNAATAIEAKRISFSLLMLTVEALSNLPSDARGRFQTILALAEETAAQAASGTMVVVDTGLGTAQYHLLESGEESSGTD
eukprot:s6421_g1.t2